MKQMIPLDDTFDNAVETLFSDAPQMGAFGPVDDLTRRRMINEVIDLASDTQTQHSTLSSRSPHPTRFHWMLAGGFAAGLALISIVSIYFLTPSLKSSPTAPIAYFGEVQELEGDLYFDNYEATKNAPVPVGSTITTTDDAAMLRLPTGISWQLAPHASGSIRSVTSDRLQVALRSGKNWFRVDPSRQGPSFSVMTPLGRIDVIGTIFMVESTPVTVMITLLKGTVQITLPSGDTQTVSAGQTLDLGDNIQRRLTEEETETMHTHLKTLRWMDTQKHAAKTPASPIFPIAEENTIKHVRPTQPSLNQLMNQIQQQRTRRNWGKVEGLYKQLFRMAKGSETAIVSRVSLGELYLSKLQRSDRALKQFDIYLKSGHTALLPEASYGRCKALRAMGQTAKETRCLDAYLKRFANTIQAKKAKSRLEILNP